MAIVLLGSSVAHSQTRQVVAWGANPCGQTVLPALNGPFVAVSAGNFHNLALKPDGTITAWGFDACGRTNVPSPNQDFVAVAAGGYHSLGLKADGTIVAFGCNDEDQIDVPAPNANFVAIAGGDAFSLGLKSDSSVVAWGNNDFGQCTVPPPNDGFVAIAAGFYHGLALKANGTIVAWGFNGDGQGDVPAPNAGFVAIAAGGAHSLGLKTDGTVVAWGDNASGQCSVPAPNANFVAIAAGGAHSLGLKSGGTVVAWGDNAEGQCNVPAPNEGFVALAAGSAHSVGVRSNAKLFVDRFAIGANTGVSWLDAYTDLQSALLPAEPGTMVWVADGTYPPTIGSDRSIAFQLKSGVAVYGGFSGFETALEQRNWSTNPTILSGDVGVQADSTDNSYHVIIANDCDATSVLDGFTVTRGNGNGSYPNSAGGGMFNHAGSPTIGHVTFLKNSSRVGGGVYNRGAAHPDLSNVTFSQNYADSGGAVANIGTANAKITNATFWRNIAGHGGAMYHDQGNATSLTNVTFARNVASSGGHAIHNAMGSLALINAILWDDSAPTTNEISNGPAGATLISYSLVKGSGGSGPGWNGALGTDGSNNIDADPMFVNAGAGNLRLAGGSPAIDAGTNAAPNLLATDLDGNPRIIGDSVDIGAYENLTGAVAPVALDDSASVLRGYAVVIDVLANDSDSDGFIDSTSVTVVTPPANGIALVDSVTGEITYTHNGSPTDTDSLTYTVRDDDGTVSNVASVHIAVGVATAVGDLPGPGTATRFALHQNSPNPFNPSTSIAFDVPAGGGQVRLDIYDVRGHLVARLVDGRQSGGSKRVRWDGTDRHGQRVSSGVYFYRLTAPGFEQTRKMTLVE